MPVYLCSPGANETDPWKHCIQVFQKPYDVNETKVTLANGTIEWNVAIEQLKENGPSNTNALRKIRHAEVVLVDDVCVAFDRYWLRLRWPGTRGGFAGYVAMDVRSIVGMESAIIHTSSSAPDEQIPEPADDPLEEDKAEENNSMPSSEPFEVDSGSMICRRTALPFPSTGILKLLPPYDDQVRAALPPYPTEQVFCRICREGLNEDAEELPAATEDELEVRQGLDQDTGDISAAEETDGLGGINPSEKQDQGPILPHPTYAPHPEVINNPMLAPCECSGSMAFVHYLCVEQWRCRSRHPAAMNGLNCETCKAPYALKPPAIRPRDDLGGPFGRQNGELEDAMPPHVMQALRQPHIWWQIGAVIVRRRWLRPLAPVIMSPLVALYCRARRLLKKRGVARRRWACSLCRRRARWKCVRCLRSYYCSRQCQNVSWHIIHKHVCYKPSRFYQSVAFYGLLAVIVFPGSLCDPLMYLIGLAQVPISFIIMGILGGGAATFLKKLAGVDLRGRRMEMVVVLATIWLTLLSWGLLRAFLGNPGACFGVTGRYSVSADDLSSTYLLRFLYWSLFIPARMVCRAFDSKIGLGLKWTRMCSTSESPEQLGNANESFFIRAEPFEDSGSEQCAADLLLVSSLYIAAACSFVGSSALKHHERQQRRRRHLHQD